MVALKATCPLCGETGYLDANGELYQCANPSCLNVWEAEEEKRVLAFRPARRKKPR
jgi:hypothetical protein